MRNFWIKALLILAFTLSAQAQILVYRGAMVQKRAGSGAEARHEYRSYLILSVSTGSYRKIDYFPGSGNFYMTLPEARCLTNRVAVRDGRSQTVLASAQQGSETEPVTALFAKGVNSRLQIGTNNVTTAAQVLTWSLRSAGPDETGVVEAAEETGLFYFNQTLTHPINNRKETMEQAERRIQTYLEAAGYREIEIK
jgi:hypothetical protein